MVLLLQRARLDPIRYIQRDFITTKGTIRSYSLHSVRSHTLKGTIRTYSLHSVRSHTLKGTIRSYSLHSVRSHTLKGTIRSYSLRSWRFLAHKKERLTKNHLSHFISEKGCRNQINYITA